MCTMSGLGTDLGTEGEGGGGGGGKAIVPPCPALFIISRDVSGVLCRMSVKKGGEEHIATELRDYGTEEQKNTDHRPQNAEKQKQKKHANVGRNG